MIDKIKYIIGQLLIGAAVRIMTRDQVLGTVKVFAKIHHDLDPHTARVEAMPGKTRLDLTREGKVVASLILRDVTRSFGEGTTATFVDAARFLQVSRNPWMN